MELFSTQEAFDLAQTKMSATVTDGRMMATGAQPAPWCWAAAATLILLVVVGSMIRLSRQLEFKVNVTARKAVDVNDLATYSNPRRLAQIVQRFGRPAQQEHKKRLRWHSSVRDYTR